MASVLETRRPVVSRLVLEHLRVKPGHVEDLFLVKNIFCHSKEGIFAALHVIKKLVRSEFNYCVNQSRDAELIIRCTVPFDGERVDVSNVSFKFDDRYIKIYKLASISALPDGKDTYYNATMKALPAYTEGLTFLGYPVGFSDVLEDMEAHTNPELSSSTMNTLGLVVGPVGGVLKVNIKFSLSPEDFLYTIRVIPRGEYRFAVDQNGDFYMKWNRVQLVEWLASAHYLVDNHMVKFYRVRTVRHRITALDKATQPVYYRVRPEDHWECIAD